MTLKVKVDRDTDFAEVNQVIAWLAGVESLPPCGIVYGETQTTIEFTADDTNKLGWNTIPYDAQARGAKT